MFAVSYVADGDVLCRDSDRDKVDSSMATKVESGDDEEMGEERSKDVLELGETQRNHKLRNSALADAKKSTSGE